MFFRIGILKNFANFIGKHLCWSFFLMKLQALRPATLLKTRLQHRCFPMKFAKFLRTPFFTEHLWWLLLKIMNSSSYLRVLPTVATKQVSPILLQEPINDFAVCKRCRGTLLLVEDVTKSHSFGNGNYISQKGATLFNRLT